MKRVQSNNQSGSHNQHSQYKGLNVIDRHLLYKCPEEHRFQAAGNERNKKEF